MAAVPETLADLFREGTTGDVLSAAMDPDKHAELKAEISGVPEFDWGMVESAAFDAYAQMLDVRLVDIFCGAWVRLRELQEYLDTDKHPHDEVSMVPLAKHSIESSHRPSLELHYRGQKLAELVFDVQLELQMEGFVLKIQDGRIREVEAGSFRGSGTVKCRDQVLATAATPEFRLPGRVDLGEGTRIPKR